MIEMMKLSQLAQVLGGELVGQDGGFEAVSTDSRSISSGHLFVALKGDNFDGSQFVSLAAEKGAVAALINKNSYHGEIMPCPVVLVQDTRLALGQLAGYWRDQFPIPVIGITGSNGKTTVKEMLTAILQEAAGSEEAVLATRGNFNNDIGMPLTLLRLRKQHRYAVIEMGMNHAGEIDYLSRIARPDVAVINNAGTAHIANLGTEEAIARAKGEIFAGLGRQGIAVINADERYASMWRTLAGAHETVEFGLDTEASVRGSCHSSEFMQNIEVETVQGKFTANLHVPGEHNARNALASTAAAIALKVPVSAIASGLGKFSGVSGRLQRKAGLNGSIVIDDTYNANPASMRAAIGVLSRAAGEKVFVMGDMGELGIEAPKMHAEMGVAAREMGVNRLYAMGELSSYAVKEFGIGARHFDSAEALIKELKPVLNRDSTVLVKGSRFMKMERVVKEIACEQAN